MILGFDLCADRSAHKVVRLKDVVQATAAAANVHFKVKVECVTSHPEPERLKRDVV